MRALRNTTRRWTTLRPSATHLAGRRGISFCYAMVVFTAMMCLGGVFMQVGANAVRSTYSRYKHKQALFLAESAVDRALWMMNASAAGIDDLNNTLAITQAEIDDGITKNYTSPMWELADGQYQFAAIAPHDGVAGTIEVQGVGLSRDGSREDLLVVVRKDAADGAGGFIAPDCFKYALFSDHNLTIQSTTYLNGNPSWGGAGIYANGHVLFESTNSTVIGPVQATGTITGTFTHLPTSTDRFEYAARKVLPEINLARYDAIADEHYGTGGAVSLVAGADGSAGTHADPWIIFVDGKAILSGPLSGIGMIVATDGFEIAGDVYYPAPGDSWALVTTGTFEITGSSEIHSLIYCHDTDDEAAFVANGTPEVFGAVVADVITLETDFTIVWDDDPTQIEELPGSATSGGAPVTDILYWERV
jgi:hypothetical protein